VLALVGLMQKLLQAQLLGLREALEGTHNLPDGHPIGRDGLGRR